MRELLDFLADISDNHEGFFIEAEGRPESINRFLNNYNRTHPAVTIHNDGIRTLSDDVDKCKRFNNISNIRNRGPYIDSNIVVVFCL